MVQAAAPRTGGGGLHRSASVPAGLRPRARGSQRGGRASPRLAEGVLLVARQAGSCAASAWEPFHFRRHGDGCISFKPATRPGTVEESEELFLNADWRRPVVAAAWRSFVPGAGVGTARSVSGEALSCSGASGDGDALYPFSLTYAPLQGGPGEEEQLPTQRRTLMLAAGDSRTRDTWLASFSGKPLPSGARGVAPTPTPAPRASARAPTAAETAKAPWRRKPRRPGVDKLVAALPRLRQSAVTCPGGFGMLGSRPALAPEGERQRLSPGDGNLWASYSDFAVVRELYDGYAADPLAAPEKTMPRAGTAVGGGSLDAGPDDFLGRYLDRQAEIEGLLKQRPARRFPPSLAASPVGGRPGDDAGVVDRLLPAAPAAEAGALDGVLTRPLRLERKTSNLRLDGEVLRNDEWSGGAMFVPPDAQNFRFTVVPLDELDTRPVFIGIAPADAAHHSPS
ncbi:unnamed protein product [Prorocentrum cordatum]|uniref:Uncharacterized protein n=1 Tax=Prorocentrum cordatum TaxID=2364126 RepID=A0ABN9XNW0_9DINO|nr:unnamed protein product [Polarella glacialis]